jgi:hypothetical protein
MSIKGLEEQAACNIFRPKAQAAAPYWNAGEIKSRPDVETLPAGV